MIANLKKKPFIFTVIGLLLIALVGCTTMTNLSDSEEIKVDKPNIEKQIRIEKAEEYTKESIIGMQPQEFEKFLGQPYVKNIYFSNKGIEYNDALKNIVEEWIYTIQDEKEDKALYIYLKDYKISQAKIDDYKNMLNKAYKYKDSDYKITSYNHEKNIAYFEPNVDELKEKYLGKDIEEFNKAYNRTYGSTEVFNREGFQLNHYLLQVENSTECIGAIYVLVKDGVVVNIKVDEANFIYDRIDEHFKYEEAKSPLESNQYHCYYATLANDQKIQLCIYSTGNVVKGTYVNEKDEEIKLKGILDGRKIKLTTDGNEFFSGSMETVDNITGIISILGKKSEEIKLELLDIVPAEYGHRYANMGAEDDAEIESFAKEVKMLAKYNKKDKIADIICYPISVNIDGKKVEIKNREEFVKNYDQIFNKELKDVLSKAFTKNMFSRSEGVMMGDGMKNIWFTYIYFNKKDELCIISINN